jgi:predicted flap endonuclease-1-like 5' DNA nuclease
MNFDGTTILIIAGVLAVLIILLALLARRGRSQSGEAVGHTPKVATPTGAQGRTVTDEGASAARDVAGEILGVDQHLNIPPADGPPDNLQTLKGVGPKLASQLNAAGITRFEQIAGLSPNEAAALDAKMGAFQGRIERDRVVEQARYLARDDRDGYEAIFGKLGSAG